MSTERGNVLRGALLMAAAAVAFAVMHGSVRWVSAEIHPFEIAFFRNLFGLLVLIPWFVTQGLRPLRTKRFGLHLLRASSNVVAMVIAVHIFMGKVIAMIFFQMLIRWSMPRFRYDQVMNLGWKILLPLSLANIIVTGFFILLAQEVMG